MRTIKTTVTIGSDRKLILQLPPDITPGKYHVVLIIEEQPMSLEKHSLLDFPVDDLGEWPEDLSLRREELYDDFGRLQ
jgi:hypothetical protein